MVNALVLVQLLVMLLAIASLQLTHLRLFPIKKLKNNSTVNVYITLHVCEYIYKVNLLE